MNKIQTIKEQDSDKDDAMWNKIYIVIMFCLIAPAAATAVFIAIVVIYGLALAIG